MTARRLELLTGEDRWMGSFASLQATAHRIAAEKGWHERERSLAEQIALMHSELSEALEAVRDGLPAAYADVVDNGDGDAAPPKPEGWGVEMADCVIRIMDTLAHHGIDLGTLIHLKNEYNRTRPYRHGGKAL